MRADSPSRTAEWVALCRALETLGPPETRVLCDPVAAAFLPPHLEALVVGARLTGGLITLVPRGVPAFVVARHRAIDDALEQAVREGCRQIVLLGAGYDSRAFRLPFLDRETVLLEIDHPATGLRKHALVQQRGLLPRADRRALIVDFERDDLADRLDGAGLDASRPTFFIWEGVTMYLGSPAIDATLEVMRGYPGWLAFDLWHEPRTVVRRLARAGLGLAFGEGIRFWLDPGELAGHLAARGFELTELLDPHTLDARYYRPVGRRLGTSAMSLALARS